MKIKNIIFLITIISYLAPFPSYASGSPSVSSVKPKREQKRLEEEGLLNFRKCSIVAGTLVGCVLLEKNMSETIALSSLFLITNFFIEKSFPSEKSEIDKYDQLSSSWGARSFDQQIEEAQKIEENKFENEDLNIDDLDDDYDEKEEQDDFKSLDIAVVFTDPINPDKKIVHQEVHKGSVSETKFKKPYGWNYETQIKYHIDGQIEKEDLTKWQVFLLNGIEEEKRNFIISKGTAVFESEVKVGQKGENLNPKSMIATFKTSTKLSLPDGKVFRYETNFDITDPSKLKK